MSPVVLLVTLITFAVGLLTLKAAEMSRLRADLVSYQLRFPRQLELENVTHFLAGLTGLLLPWWRRWLVTPFVVAEVYADASGIEHRLTVPRPWSSVVENLLQAHLPAARYEISDAAPPDVTAGAEYRLSTSLRLLQGDASALSARLLSALQPLRRGEALVVQWIITASGPVQPAQAAANPGRLGPLGTAPALSPEQVAALREKQAQPLLLSTGRIGVTAASRDRQRQLLRRVEATWHSTRAPGVQMRRRLMGERTIGDRVQRRSVPLSVWPARFNTDELAGLIGWPIGIEQVPGLVLGGCRALAPSPSIPTVGTVIGEATFPGHARPVALEPEARVRHTGVLGPTGTGKSTLLLRMIEQDLAAGYGVVCVDPKGDLIEAVLARVPPRRRADVIVLDPADDERPVGLNPLRGATGAQAEVAVENLVGLLKSLYRSSWGPRTDDILRAAFLTLAGSGRATLCEVPVLLTDAAYRRRIIGALDDPVGLESFWGWYEGLSNAERLAVVGPPLNKIRAFTMRRRVRRIVGQLNPALDLHRVLAEQQVLLVSLASGLLGEEAAALLGALVIAELWNATTARAGTAPERRAPIMAHLDEWHRFVHLPTAMPSVLAEARGLGLGLTLATQHLGQLPDAVRDALLNNARSKVCFQLSAHDARVMARELGSGLTEAELQGLNAFECVAHIFASGRTQPAVTVRTHPAGPDHSDPGAIRKRSRQRYGVDHRQVEADIRGRQRASEPDAPIGRRPRARGRS